MAQKRKTKRACSYVVDATLGMEMPRAFRSARSATVYARSLSKKTRGEVVVESKCGSSSKLLGSCVKGKCSPMRTGRNRSIRGLAGEPNSVYLRDAVDTYNHVGTLVDNNNAALLAIVSAIEGLRQTIEEKG